MTLNEVVWGAITLVGAATLIWLVSLLHQGTQAVRQHTKGSAFGVTVSNVLDTVDSILSNASHTIVVELKAKTADGKLTKDEIDEIVQHVKTEALSLLGKDAQTILVALVGDYDKWLQTIVTTKVTELAKLQNANVVTD